MKVISTIFKQNQLGIVFMVCASLFTALGQLLWKLSDGEVSFFLFGGLFLYGIGAILMIIAFRFGSLSVLHPLLSLSYVFAILLGQYVLQETLSFLNYVGILFIIFGSILIGGADQ